MPPRISKAVLMRTPIPISKAVPLPVLLQSQISKAVPLSVLLLNLLEILKLQIQPPLKGVALGGSLLP